MMRWRQAPFSGMALGEGIHSVVGLAISGFLFLTGLGPVDLLAFLAPESQGRPPRESAAPQPPPPVREVPAPLPE